ncbi:TIGR02587 family membrane protein [Mesorhizobium sp. CAU 1732]|uniref:TIGR02587 family membrane protein n=1 Tax=Mesorhizobium sp. CAU 1732 TaxID=3140358 RepID=UPI003260B2A1
MKKTPSERSRAAKPWRDLGRAAGGAVVFSLPILMTMEMWWLGFYMDRLRLLVLFALTFPLLMGLSRQIGFEDSRSWGGDFLDSLIALGIGALVSSTVLCIFGVITPDMSLDEIVGKIALQTVPAAIGALLARSQLGRSEDDETGEREEGYWGELFLMAVGALFLGFNVAPTEEMILISYQMTSWHALALVVLSLGIMHAFVFSLGFAGGSEVGPDDPWWSGFVRLTLPGYVIAITISLLVLWLFGRTDGNAFHMTAFATIVLAFPSAIGAAAARLIL